MRCIVYISAAIGHMKTEDLIDIVESSRRHNSASEITGLLIYTDGNFMQLIEGATESIQETMVRIGKDCRHHHLRVLMDSILPERLFGLWSMAYPNVRELTEKGLSKYSFSDPEKAYPQVGRKQALQLLDSYRMMFER